MPQMPESAEKSLPGRHLLAAGAVKNKEEQ
jgi:hypothetical protein